MPCSQDLDQIYDFSKYTEMQNDELVEEIFKEQREIGENIPDQNMISVFLFELNQTLKDKKSQIISKLNGKMKGIEIVHLITSFFKKNHLYYYLKV